MAGQTPSSASSPPALATPTVRIAVLIAMPDASRKHQHHGDESELPVVEIGLVDVNVKDDGRETPSRDSS